MRKQLLAIRKKKRRKKKKKGGSNKSHYPLNKKMILVELVELV